MSYTPRRMNPAWRWMRSNMLNLSFTANKVVVIRDWRLAGANIVLSLAIVGWVIFSLFLGKTYIVTEVPTGVSSAWGLASTDYTSSQTAIYNGAASFCDSLTNYKFKYSDDWIYDTPVCAYYSGAELISKLPSGDVMFFTTHIHETINQRYIKPGGGCLSDPNGLGAATEVMGRCEHSKSMNFLAPGIEDSYFAFNHYFDSIVQSGAKPITYVRREGSDEDLYTFEKGDAIRLKVSEWLNVAEIELDKPFNEQNGGWDIVGFEGAGEDTENYPYVRTSGIRLNIDVKYHNYHLDKDNVVNMGNEDVYAVITVSPKIGWFSKGNEIVYSQDPATTFDINNPITVSSGDPNGIYYDFYRYGILFDIKQTGLVGEIDYVFILIQLTSGVVMLGIATTVVSFFAKFCLGNESEIYRGVIQEEYEVGKEAARYAAQACVATKSFKDADADGKGDLDFDELRILIKESFSKNYLDEGEDSHFNEEEITGMAYYLMRAADDHLNDRILDRREKTPEELRHSKISLHEWQELSTNGVFKFKNLKTTSKEHIKNTGWARNSLKKRQSVKNLKTLNKV
jgi:hypothetical protein